MHWNYIFVDSTLKLLFPFAFRLVRSVNPPDPSFAVTLLISSFYAASVLCSRFTALCGAISLLLVALRLLKILGFFLSAPLSTLLRRECVLRFGTVSASIVEILLCFCQLVLFGLQGRVYSFSVRSDRAVYCGYSSFKYAGKLQFKTIFVFQFINENSLTIKYIGFN